MAGRRPIHTLQETHLLDRRRTDARTPGADRPNGARGSRILGGRGYAKPALLLLLGALAAGGPSHADLDRAALVAALNARAAPVQAANPAGTGRLRVRAGSDRYSLVVPDPADGSEPARGPISSPLNAYWSPVPTHGYFDLHLSHSADGSWIKGRTGSRSPDGIRGVLRDESARAKAMIDYAPDEVVVDVSLETYRASALFCGRLRGGAPRHCCSLVHVALHGQETVRLHSLIIASTPMQRDRLVRDFARVMDSLTLHPD